MNQVKYYALIAFISLGILSCNWKPPHSNEGMTASVSIKDTISLKDTSAFDSILDIKDSITQTVAIDSQIIKTPTSNETIDTRNITPNEVIAFAETLVGTPYVYGSTDPKVGFDCSGFITYVFNRFKIKVPRSSVQFTNVGKTVPVENAKRGDIILFTDPDFDNTTSTVVGHMGLITSNENNLINFIHSTSGKAMAVSVTPFNEHYKKRFVRIGRIFPQNAF